MDLIKIGGRIKAYRKTIGISQEKLAEMINVSPHYIYEIERGMKSMSLETLINLSEALQLSADYILFGSTHNDNTSLSEQLSKMDEKQRERAESAFKAILPYIK
ncbi:MAG: helix-turn-helix transcriptional regulator [Oscillospiraceae bacterium]|nr:helix-turn-helix transcriptional regulator [Oscillospiraceae bacterium]